MLPSVAELLGAACADAHGRRRPYRRTTHARRPRQRRAAPPGGRITLAALVAAAPSLRLLVTSREPLRIAGETELDLPPMNETTVSRCSSTGHVRQRPTSRNLPTSTSSCAGSTVSRSPSSSRPRGRSCSLPAQLLESSRQTAGHPEGHARRRRPPRDAPCDDRVEPRPPRSTMSRSSSLGSPSFAARCTLETAEAGLRRRPRHAGFARRQEPPPTSHRTRRRAERFWMLETIREFAGGAARGFGRCPARS